MTSSIPLTRRSRHDTVAPLNSINSLKKQNSSIGNSNSLHNNSNHCQSSVCSNSVTSKTSYYSGSRKQQTTTPSVNMSPVVNPRSKLQLVSTNNTANRSTRRPLGNNSNHGSGRNSFNTINSKSSDSFPKLNQQQQHNQQQFDACHKSSGTISTDSTTDVSSTLDKDMNSHNGGNSYTAASKSSRTSVSANRKNTNDNLFATFNSSTPDVFGGTATNEFDFVARTPIVSKHNGGKNANEDLFAEFNNSTPNFGTSAFDFVVTSTPRTPQPARALFSPEQQIDYKSSDNLQKQLPLAMQNCDEESSLGDLNALKGWNPDHTDNQRGNKNKNEPPVNPKRTRSANSIQPKRSDPQFNSSFHKTNNNSYSGNFFSTQDSEPPAPVDTKTFGVSVRNRNSSSKRGPPPPPPLASQKGGSTNGGATFLKPPEADLKSAPKHRKIKKITAADLGLTSDEMKDKKLVAAAMKKWKQEQKLKKERGELDDEDDDEDEPEQENSVGKEEFEQKSSARGRASTRNTDTREEVARPRSKSRNRGGDTSGGGLQREKSFKRSSTATTTSSTQDRNVSRTLNENESVRNDDHRSKRRERSFGDDEDEKLPRRVEERSERRSRAVTKDDDDEAHNDRRPRRTDERSERRSRVMDDEHEDRRSRRVDERSERRSRAMPEADEELDGRRSRRVDERSERRSRAVDEVNDENDGQMSRRNKNSDETDRRQPRKDHDDDRRSRHARDEKDRRPRNEQGRQSRDEQGRRPRDEKERPRDEQERRPRDKSRVRSQRDDNDEEERRQSSARDKSRARSRPDEDVRRSDSTRDKSRVRNTRPDGAHFSRQRDDDVSENDKRSSARDKSQLRSTRPDGDHFSRQHDADNDGGSENDRRSSARDKSRPRNARPDGSHFGGDREEAARPKSRGRALRSRSTKEDSVSPPSKPVDQRSSEACNTSRLSKLRNMFGRDDHSSPRQQQKQQTNQIAQNEHEEDFQVRYSKSDSKDSKQRKASTTDNAEWDKNMDGRSGIESWTDSISNLNPDQCAFNPQTGEIAFKSNYDSTSNLSPITFVSVLEVPNFAGLEAPDFCSTDGDNCPNPFRRKPALEERSRTSENRSNRSQRSSEVNTRSKTRTNGTDGNKKRSVFERMSRNNRRPQKEAPPTVEEESEDINDFDDNQSDQLRGTAFSSSVVSVDEMTPVVEPTASPQLDSRGFTTKLLDAGITADQYKKLVQAGLVIREIK